MDKMAYLQQIAGDGNNANHKTGGGNNFLSKIFNVVTLAIVGVAILLIIGASALTKEFNKVDTRDRDLMEQSYWQAEYLSKQTFQKYANEVKNSDLRNLTASLKSTLNEILGSGKKLLEGEYKVKLSGSEKTGIAATEKTNNEKLNVKLEDGRLSGTLDRVFLREITLQIAYLRAYNSGVVERTKNVKVQQFAKKITENLENIYQQFHDFKSPTM